jgi:hypothetical protein
MLTESIVIAQFGSKFTVTVILEAEVIREGVQSLSSLAQIFWGVAESSRYAFVAREPP